MKYIVRTLVLLMMIGLGSCEFTELDKQDNPNEVTPENASVNDLYNNIQLTFRNFYNNAQGNPGSMARMYHNNNFNYIAAITPQTLNGIWSNAYSQLYPDIDALVTLADDRGLDIHAGSAKIMKAYTMMVLVDLLGDVPNSEAGKGTDVISPVADPGDQVYSAAISLIDAAITQLTGTNAGAPAADNFYSGDADKWVKFGNTLKLRAALNTKDGGTIASLASGGNIISETSDDFQFNFGNQRNNPNSRHPFYNSHYEQGDGAYLSNYFMWLLRAEKETAAGIPVVDPRIRYYFYRKVDDSVGQDQTTYSCHFSALPDQSAKPPHWEAITGDARIPYCYASEDGYIGRDFFNGEGIPPDGPIRTSYGLYPGGGDFDHNAYIDTRQAGTSGGLGQGIYPIMLASFVDFMRAEAALTLGTGEDAAALLESGIRKSIAKVQGFASLVPATMSKTVVIRGEEFPVEATFVPKADDVDEYVTFVMDNFAAADAAEKENILAKEYLIAAWGNGLEAYNQWRRTGLPSNTPPPLEPSAGEFARSYLLPANHVDRNQNATQKSLTDRVFWDDGSTQLY